MKPFSCGFLDLCPSGAEYRTQFVGVFIAGLILSAVVMGFLVIKALELRSFYRWKAEVSNSKKMLQENEPKKVEEEDNAGQGDTTASNAAHRRLLLPSVPVVDIAFQGLSVVVDGNAGGSDSKRIILDDASGEFPSGSVTAVMGPSGAGKTTLVDAILGNVSCTSGAFTINNKPIKTNLLSSLPAGSIGYVPQQDILMDSLTVREVLEYAVSVRLSSSSWTRKEKKELVDAVIAVLGLTKCERLVIGRPGAKQAISGGQRKRVSIGIELVANPSVLILDECTTGLDATSALELMECLQQIAKEGRTVIAILHQPRYEIFERTLDRVMLMAKGKIVYKGAADEAMPHFERLGYQRQQQQSNPAEFLLEVLSTADEAALNSFFEENAKQQGEGGDENSVHLDDSGEEGSEMNDEEQEDDDQTERTWLQKLMQLVKGRRRRRKGVVSVWRYIWHAAWRQWLQRYRSPGAVVVLVVVHLLLGVVLGLGFLSGNGNIFLGPVPTEIASLCPPPLTSLCRTLPVDWMPLKMSSLYLSLALGSAALVPSVFTFGGEMAVLRREILSGGWRARVGIVTGKNLAEAPFILAGALVFSSIYILMLRPDSSWYLQYMLFLGVETAAYGLGYMLSQLLPLQSAHVVGVVTIFGFTVFSGIAPNLRDGESLGPLRILWDLSFARYAVEASVIAQTEAIKASGSAFELSTKLWLEDRGFGTEGIGVFWGDVGIMIAIGIGFRVIAGLLLWYQTRRDRRSIFQRFFGALVKLLKNVKLWPVLLACFALFSPSASALTLTSNGVCNFCGAAIFPICNCPAGFYCSNSSRPFCERCPAGYYCPVTGDVPPLPCPSGSWCPTNVYVPVTCADGSVCTSERSFYILGIIFCFAILGLILLVHLWVRGYFRGLVGFLKKKFDSFKKKKLTREQSDESREDGENSAEQEGEEDEVEQTQTFDITLEKISAKRGRWLSYPVPWRRFGAKTVLADISGKFNNGELTAIMGPSGCGKTTLLKVLRGMLPFSAGVIRVNGQVCKKGLSNFKKVIGFVPQDDDTVDPLMTVKEAISHSARLRLPGNTSFKEKAKHVRETLKLLALEEIENQLVGTGDIGAMRGVSGGQRKRTNIGVELVTQPSVLLLDEPTSGLDSHIAASVADVLKRIAKKKGVTVVATVHQPSQAVFDKFDSLVLLEEGGRVVYWGPTEGAVPYVMETLGIEPPPNTAAPDFLLDVLSERKKKEQNDERENEEGSEEESKETSGEEEEEEERNEEEGDEKVEWWRKVLNLFWGRGGRRTPLFYMQLLWQVCRQIRRSLRTLVVSLVLACLVFGGTGIYLAIAFTDAKYAIPVPTEIAQWCPRAINDFTETQSFDQPCNPNHPNNEVQGLVAMYFSMALGGVAAAFSIWTFGADRAISRREHSGGVDTLAYFLSANFVDAIKCAVYALFFLSTYFIIATPWGDFTDYWLLCYCYLLLTYGLGYIISFLLQPANAAIVATVAGVTAGLGSGLVFKFTPMWTFFFGEGLFQAEAQYVVDHYTETRWLTDYADTFYGYTIGSNTIRNDELIMLAFAIMFRVIAYITMRLTM